MKKTDDFFAYDHAFLIFYSVCPVQATGVVVDENNQPVIGATVLQQGTANGATTIWTGCLHLLSLTEKRTGNLLYRLCQGHRASQPGFAGCAQ